MSTLYFVCGGPTEADGFLTDVFGEFEEYSLDRAGIFSYCNASDGLLGCLRIGSHWILSGDSDVVFRWGPTIAAKLSETGLAGEFYGQTTAGYYEMVKYRNGLETERVLDRYSEAVGRTNFKRRRLSMDHLWTAADKLLPISCDDVFNHPALWIKPAR